MENVEIATQTAELAMVQAVLTASTALMAKCCIISLVWTPVLIGRMPLIRAEYVSV